MKASSQAGGYYPVFLNLSGKRCVVIGGGQVARRKVEALLEHGASVSVISPGLCPELTGLAAARRITAVARNYREGDLQDMAIAIAATDDNETNRTISQEARRRGVLVNVVDDAGLSDFIAPAYLRRGDVTIAVSTSGRSPALARKIRTRLESEFGDEYATLALLIDEVRSEIKERGIKVSNDTWQKALDLDSLSDLLKREGSQKTRTVLLDSLKKAD